MSVQQWDVEGGGAGHPDVFDLDETSTRHLRHRVRELLGNREDGYVDDAVLVADELATNAFQHGGAPRTCRLRLVEGGGACGSRSTTRGRASPRSASPTAPAGAA